MAPHSSVDGRVRMENDLQDFCLLNNLKNDSTLKRNFLLMFKFLFSPQVWQKLLTSLN